MKLGVMQPYFIPYLGYWQLMNLVDTYVVYDDVNYIKGGYAHRNSILLGGKPHSIHLTLCGASPNLRFNEVTVSPDTLWRKKLLSTMRQAYAKAPYFNEVFPVIETILNGTEEPISDFLLNSFQEIAKYLEIQTKFVLSSSIPKDDTLKGRHKLYQMFEYFGATEYYNSVNGIPLYTPYQHEFKERGIELNFLKIKEIEYPQFKNEFVSNLSIIDVMMFNTQEQCKELLSQYDIIKE